MKTYYLVILLAVITFSCSKNDTPTPAPTPGIAVPTVSTTTAAQVAATSLSTGGNVSADGGSSVTARGVCWSTASNPQVSGNHTNDGSGTGAFTSSVTGLAASTTYYIKAYATNSKGTAYGNELVVTTPANTVKISGFSPASAISGAQVIISGTDFSSTPANNLVKFGEASATVVSAVSTALTVTVPVQAVSGNITVTVNGVTDTSAAVFNKTAVLSAFAGTQNAGGFLDGIGTAAKFKYPLGIAIDPAGNLFVADADNHSIRKITPAGVVTTVAGNGTAGHVDGNGAAARFQSPYDVAVDSHGNLFVTESYGNYIRKITPSGDVTTFAGNGAPGYVNGNGTAAQFNFPWSIAVDANDNVYVGDYNNYRLRKITPSGDVSTFAGNGLPLQQGGDMFGPRDITIDANGNLFVVGTAWALTQIQKVTPAGVISTYSAIIGAGWADGPLSTAQFNNVKSVCTDMYGNMYVSDNGYPVGSQFIRKISPTGLVTTLINTTENTPTGAIIADKLGNIFITKCNGGSVLKLSL